MELPEQIETWRQFFELQKDYLSDLHEQVREGRPWVSIEFTHLVLHSPRLAELILENPEDTLKAGQVAIEKMDLPTSSDEAVDRIEIRVYDLPVEQHIMIRDIRSKHLEKLVQIEGIVRQKSDVRPQVTSARFECPSCGNIIPVLQLDTKFREPSRCGCGRKGKFKLLSKELVDAQSLTLEEAPEDLDGGEQPKRMKILLKRDLVSPMTDKKTNPGSRVTIVGAIKELPIILQTGGQSTRFDLIIDANSAQTVQEDFTQIDLAQEEIIEIKELSQDPDLFEKLVSSIAPSIYGHEFIKQALLLQLFGGLHKTRDMGVKSRGDIHVLLIGDPGAAKSQILRRIASIAPKARYVAGMGASGKGLTASVVKDDFLRGWALEAGALVLANKGMVCTTADAEFIQENGNRMSFAELFQGHEDDVIYPEFRVLGLDERTQQIRPFAVKRAFRKPNDLTMYRFTTRTGRQLSLTEGNEVYVAREGGTWVPVQTVTKGEYVGIPKCVRVDTSDEFSKEFSYIAGLIASDGNIRLTNKNAKTAFYNTNKELIKTFKDHLGAEGVKHNTYLRKKGRRFTIRNNGAQTRKDLFEVYNCQKVFAKKLIWFGVPSGNKSTKNALNRKISQYSDSTIAEFLRGVFDGDGSIRKNPNEATITTGMKENAYLFQKLLLRLGILSSVKPSSHSWHCDVRGSGECRRFLDIVGTNHPEKLRRFRSLRKENTKDRMDVLPAHKELFNDLLGNRKGQIGGATYRYVWNCARGAIPSRSRVAMMNERLHSARLQRFVEGDLAWDKVVSITEESANTVYDFTMEGTNNFVANDIIMHNCIDEMDKMSTEDTSAMHEALEQQTVSIAKANIQATLRCETTVLAAANPKFGRFDPFEIISKQIDMPPTLLNRFDLIFPVRDLPDRAKDEKLASFILDLHTGGEGKEGVIRPKMIRKYIAYAKQQVHPKLSESAVKEIKDYFVKMRGGEDGVEEQAIKPIPISARQLEALIRLAEASARLRLSEKVTKRDAQISIELVHYCLQQIGMDPETGKFDLDRVTTGISASQRSHISLVKEIIQKLEAEVGKAIPVDDIIREATIKGVAEDTANDVVERLKRAGDVYSPKHGFISRL